MKSVILVVVLLFILSIPAVSDEGDVSLETLLKEMESCTSIMDEELRLKAYDALAEKLGFHLTTREQHEPGGKWLAEVDINPMDDSKTVVFVLMASEGKSSWGKIPILVLRYKSGETSVYVKWQDYLGSEAYVTCRIGSDKPQRKRWPLSTNSKATFYPDSPEGFIARLLTVEKLVLQVTPYSETPVTAVFDVRGLQETAEPYNDIHGWF